MMLAKPMPRSCPRPRANRKRPRQLPTFCARPRPFGPSPAEQICRGVLLASLAHLWRVLTRRWPHPEGLLEVVVEQRRRRFEAQFLRRQNDFGRAR
jgi:hypothetical protein